MPIAIVEQPDLRTAGRIMGRVLIGRLPTNGIVIAESNVSRLHAWIDRDTSDQFFIADGGSLAGTIVNGRAIEKRRILNDGDVIRIGTAQIVFSTDDQWPQGVLGIDLAGLPPGENVEESGLLFDCPCGAPVWFKAAARGQVHVCRHCGRSLLIPDQSSVIAQTIEAPAITEPGFPPPPQPAPEAPPVEALAEAPDFSGIDVIDDIPGGTSPIQFDEEHGLAEAGLDTHDDLEPGLTESIHDAPVMVAEHESPFLEIEKIHDPLLSDTSPLEVDAAPGAETIESMPAETPIRQTPSPQPRAPEPAEEILPIDQLTRAASHEVCSICHTALLPSEPVTACPSCGLTFHANCWQENLGCSAYGCAQVNALKSPETPAAEPAIAATDLADATPSAKDESDLEPDVFPWEFAFVAISVAGSLLGALTYGVPALIGVLGTTIYLVAFQESRKRRSVAITALLVCILGTAAGVYVSYLWWRGWPPIGPLAHRGGAQ
jgi:hypothetical protein